METCLLLHFYITEWVHKGPEEQAVESEPSMVLQPPKAWALEPLSSLPPLNPIILSDLHLSITTAPSSQ